MLGHRYCVPGALLLVVAALFAPRQVRANVTASILGFVRDSSGAVVPDAHVTATNIATGLSQTTTTDVQGEYRLLALPPGSYRVSASASGFQHFVTNNVTLLVNAQLRVDIMLQVGSQVQTVTVNATAVHVDTESTQLGNVIESRQILAMPLNGRDYLDLLPLQPGVVPVTSGTLSNDRPVAGMFANPGNVSVNGQPEYGNAFLVNGAEVNELKNMGAGLLPTLDSIQEFRLITNSYNAEYGRFSGGIMNVVTKSGSNSFHGDAFEFLRNDAIDSRNFFDPTIAKLERNQFGATAGGRILKDKLFWFSSYQGTRQIQGEYQGVIELPTNAERQGIFSPSDFVGPGGGPSAVNGSYWAQVLSGRLGYAVQNGEPYSFPGCSTTVACVFPGGVIPSAAFDKVAVNEMKYIPEANYNPGLGLYSNDSSNGTVGDDQFGERIDLNSQKTGNWSFYYDLDNSSAFTPVDTQAYSSLPGVGPFASTAPQRAQLFDIGNTKSIGSTMVNLLHLSFFRTVIQTANPASSSVSLSSLGYTTGSGTLGIVPSGPAGYPEIVPPTSFNNFSFGANWLNLLQAENTYTASDGISKVLGSHTLGLGGQFSYYQLNVRNVCAPNGTFSFNGNETGIDFADFLLGAPVNYVQCTEQFLNNRSRYGALYIQDSWKARPDLTLNPGLRWEVSMPWYDARGMTETYISGKQSVLFPTAPLGWVVPGDPGVPSTISPTRWDDFAPRFGLAYSPSITHGVLGKIFGGPNNSSIRAAYGIYYLTAPDMGNFGVIGDAPWGLYWSSTAPPLLDTPFQTRSDGTSQGQRFPFAWPVQGKPNPNFDWALAEPLFAPVYDPSNELTYTEDYNLSFQRQLSRSTLLTVAYVGTQAHHLEAFPNLNVGSAALCFQLNTEGAAPLCGPNGEDQVYTLPNGSQVYGTWVGLGNQRLGRVVYGKVNTYSNIANSSYNSLQTTLRIRARDLTVLIGYTYSKSLDDANYTLNPVDYSLSRALSPWDMTHNFVASYVWNIPFNRAFVHLPHRLTQGWQVAGITSFDTGLAVGLSDSMDLSLTGIGLDFPNLVGPVLVQNPRKAGPNGPNTYFLPSAFTQEALGTTGDANPSFFHGPGIISTDFGLMKNIPITESKYFQIRAEFFNIFNRTNFENPNGNIASGQFGVVTAARDPRIGQVSAKFIW